MKLAGSYDRERSIPGIGIPAAQRMGRCPTVNSIIVATTVAARLPYPMKTL
jgi:hypothetical protein